MHMGFERMLILGFSGTVLALMMFTNIGSVDVYGISIKIDSPLGNQQVPVGELTISGTSTDNSTSQCQVYVDWNNLKPYQLATPTGSNGSSDFSTWNFTYTSKYHLIQTGLNDLTSKITCLVPPTGPTVTKWYSINVTGTTSPNQSSNVELPLPTANNNASTSDVQTSSSQTETPIDTTNASNSDKITLDLGVEHNPVSAGERQTITLTASDPLTGNALDKVFLRLTIKDPSGNIIKDYTDNDGKLSPSFRLNEDITGTFSVLASASQAGIETTKSLTFVVQ
ncbi:MAG: hypothetical protein QOK60_03795 [Nitrososphaeraceae archaeon]|jgi:hypothetical protein|nr:hypothetical protein [Nitrososphaeraceae archaeon]MDW0138992.1 hypothetical protein [Nitrososphaeraceae archaeon]MDW0144183.1 hypothetical protein [Nitrososphaeraceae archaeon]MDW0145863.1 hypothetical protein [Nitrososphaeraceae archaeon]MDW0153624.1 hypothetical protein [Nitrososphaeraceae archaeon]